MKKIFYFLLLFLPLSLLAQGEGENWFFGYNAGIDFTGTPTATTVGSVNQWEGMASISDAAGNLLFYTNGQNVWNASHGLMTNGTGLLGHNSSSQSAVIVPYPYYPDLYYVFTVDQLAGGNGMRYSIVDMSMSGGLGAVTSTKNVLLFSNATEKITAVRHNNNSDIWVIGHEWGNNKFRAYLIDACNGLSTTPVNSYTGTVHNHVSGGYNTGAIGYLKASPQGDKLGLALFTQANTSATHFEVFDFNNATGAVSNPVTMPCPSTTTLPPGVAYYAPYGVEFSPDGSFFYGGLNATGQIYQYNMWAGSNAAIVASATLVGTGTGPNQNKIGALQLATDGKIYVARDAGSYLGTLTNPNMFGVSYTNNGIYLAGRQSGLGLPTFIQSFFLDLPDIYIGYSGDNCEGNSIYFALQGADVPTVTSVDWYFGDGNSILGASGSGTVSHTYTTSGPQTIQAYYYFGCYYVILSGTINVYAAPTANAGANVSLTCTPPTVNLSGSGGGSYAWTTSSGNIVSGANSSSPSVDAGGTYTLTVTNGNGCTDVDYVYVVDNTTSPSANAGSNTTIDCNNPTATLSGSGSGSYSWTTSGGNIVSGANTSSPVINGGGTYTLTVIDGSGCSATDNVYVTQDMANPNANAGSNAQVNCTNPTLNLSGSGGGTYAWATSNGNITGGASTSSPSINQGGLYTLTVTGSNGCTDTDNVTISSSFGTPTANIAAASQINCTNPNISLNATGSTNSSGGSTGISFSWVASAGGNITSGANSATPSINAAGTYEVTVQGTNGCTATQTISVTADASVPVANAGTAIDLDCATTSQILNGSASTGTGLTYSWTTSGGNIVSGGNTTTPTIDAGGTYTLEVTATNGCTNTDNVVVNQNTNIPIAAIVNPEDITCTDPQILLDGTTSSSGSTITYTWTTSNGNIVSGGSSDTPIIDQGGTYTLTVTNTTNNCQSTDQITIIEDNANPVANAGSSVTLTCSATTLSLDGTASSGAGISYAWVGGNIVSGANTATPDIDQPGNYTLTVTGSNGCTDNATVNVIPDANAPNVNIGSVANIDCNNQSVSLDGSGSDSGANITYSWTTANGNLTSSTTGNTATADQGGDYVLIVENTSNGCSNSATVTINMDTVSPSAIVTPNMVLNCYNLTPTIDGTQTPGTGYSYSWTTLDGTIVSGNNNAIVTISSGGTYDLTITGANGCDNTTSTTVAMDTTSPMADIEASPLTGEAPLNVDFTNNSTTTGVTYYWNFDNGTNDTIFEPSVIYTDFGTVNPYLVVTNISNGCSDSASVEIYIDGELVVSIPNVFTPNSDGTNDVFHANVRNVKELEGFIYNRWGALLYQWDGVEGGWDGYTASGLVSTEGTYFYLLNLVDAKDETHIFEGHFLLKR